MTLAAILIACFSFISQVDWAPHISDEGFLWYGALKTFQGQVPLLDFQSYFPGRYYFTAATFSFLGQDLLAVRIASWFFQVLALMLAFWTVRRVPHSKPSLILLGVLSVFWMTTMFRYYDSAFVIAAVFFGALLLENPSKSRHVAAGIFTGVALFFGVNHGWYALLIFQILVVLNALKTDPKYFLKSEACFFLGLFMGCLPLLGMMLFIPGFYAAFMDNLRVMLSRSNDPALQAPWPWIVKWSEICTRFPKPHQRILEWSHQTSMGFTYLLVPIYYCGSLLFTLVQSKDRWRQSALWTSCGVVGVIYLHHIFRRVNIVYLGEGIAPFLIGVWALGSVRISSGKKVSGMFLIFVLVLLTLLGPGLLNNVWYRIFLPKDALSKVQVGERWYWGETNQVREIDSIRRYVKENIKPSETLFLAPLLAMYYCILDKPSPVYQIYFTFLEPAHNQLKMIQNLEDKHVRWAIVGDPVIDGFSNLRFSKTHALIWEYLNNRFDPYVVEGFPKGYFLWKIKDQLVGSPTG